MKNKYRNLIIITTVLFLTINAIPSVLGKSRQSYLINFILDTEIEGEGFSNVIDGEDGEDLVSVEATDYALTILNDLGIALQDIEALEDNLEDRIRRMFNRNEVNIYDLYHLLSSLKLLEYDFDSSLLNQIYEFLNNTAQITGGFSFSNSTHLSSLTSTFYVTQLYSLIEQPIPNISVHKDWVLSCYNTDGGYGGNQTLSSTYIDTSFAVFILDDERFGDVNDLVDIDDTLAYLNSFYANNSEDFVNYGGYLPDKLAGHALLSSTYYCVRAISLIGENELNHRETSSWILKHQNFEDGGFFENSQESESGISSVIMSYYAFKSLDALNLLNKLYNEVWMVEFQYWILAIVLGSIGLIIAVIVFLWKRRRI